MLSTECHSTNHTHLPTSSETIYRHKDFSTHVKSVGVSEDDLFDIALSVFE